MAEKLSKAARKLFQRYGARGGKIGGPARARVLSPERRREISAMGAAARARKRQA